MKIGDAIAFFCSKLVHSEVAETELKEESNHARETSSTNIWSKTNNNFELFVL